MNKEKRRVPKLRFPGFTEDWEQRKLGQFTARVTRKNGGQSDLPLTISAQDGLVDQRKYFNRQVASRDMSNYYLIKKGEFAYNKSYSEGYPFGAVKRLDYYDIGALSTLYILFEITDKNISSDFIVSYYMTHLWYKEISKRAAEGARNHGLLNISTEDFFDSELNIPNSIEEQVKIGNFIKEFDKFITLHQRKLEHLNLKKKALLQKLFPKNGECYPELRFPGFTDAWEQRKFVDLFEYERPDAYIVKSDNYNDNFNIPVLTANKAFILGYTNEKNSYDKPSIIFDDFTLDRKYVDFPYMLKSSAIKILTSKSQHNLRFLFERLNATRFEVLGHARHYISVVQNTTTLCPSFEEEVCISNLLTKFDELLTLHQRKLDHLQLQKKALLQQMFV